MNSTTPNASMPSPDSKHVVDGEMNLTVRIVGFGMAAMVAAAVAIGIWHGLESPATGKAALVAGLMMAQVGFAIALIMLGSIVEGFGYGLSLGTRWPYTRNIVLLMVGGDPEAAHRVLATTVGLTALALAILDPQYTTFMGLGLVVVTALFGMGTLYVLAGRAPAVVHGTHGLLAYLVFLNYLMALAYPGAPLFGLLRGMVALHPVLFAVFMGGMVTGQRGFGKPIEGFVHPRRASQWVFVVHGLAALTVIGTLGWFSSTYPVAFTLALVQAAVGFFLFQSVNLKPKSPGTMVVFHQVMALLITTSVVLHWHW